jgi:hypothetical protein
MSQFLWSQRQDIGPSPRGGHALAYDAARKRTVLYGGLGPGGPLADTWEWDGSFWTQVADTGPSPRWMHGLAYDGTRTILFSGATPNEPNPSIMHADTWAWDGAHWTQLADTGPSARAATPLARSGTGGELILFGGWSPTAFSNDTWLFSQGSWTQVADTGPSPRAWHAVGAGANAAPVLFGGADSTTALADTWGWEAGSWSQLQDIGPAARSGAAAGTGPFVLFGGAAGGFRAPTAVSGDTWSWDGALWTQLQDMGPSARWASAAVLDSDRSCIVLFGGFTAASSLDPEASAVGDTWEIAGMTAPSTGGGIVITDGGALSTASDMGMVQYTLGSPAASAEPITVTVDGVTDAAGSPDLPAGATQGIALFTMKGRTAGTVQLTVTAGSAAGHAAVVLMDAPALGSLRSEQPSATVQGTVFLTLTVAAAEPQNRHVTVVAAELAAGVFEMIIVPPAVQGDVTHDFALPASVGKGTIHLLAMCPAGGAMTILGPVALQVD